MAQARASVASMSPLPLGNGPAAWPLIDRAQRHDWSLDAERIACPVRIVWDTADADWVELEGIGHCPQLDVPVEAAELILGFTAG